jgi:outer membrane protein assembly factor BamE (lipoprotein component of BamABCDE complex)
MKMHMKKQIYLTLAIGMMTMLTACESRITQHGNRLDPITLDKLTIGSTKQIEVEALFGKPSTRGAFNSGRIYYIAQQMEDAPGKKTALLNRTIVIFAFDDKKTLQSIEFQDENQGRTVFFLDSATPTPGETFGFFEQILGNMQTPRSSE